MTTEPDPGIRRMQEKNRPSVEAVNERLLSVEGRLAAVEEQMSLSGATQRRRIRFRSDREYRAHRAARRGSDGQG